MIRYFATSPLENFLTFLNVTNLSKLVQINHLTHCQVNSKHIPNWIATNFLDGNKMSKCL